MWIPLTVGVTPATTLQQLSTFDTEMLARLLLASPQGYSMTEKTPHRVSSVKAQHRPGAKEKPKEKPKATKKKDEISKKPKKTTPKNQTTIAVTQSLNSNSPVADVPTQVDMLEDRVPTWEEVVENFQI